MKNAPQMSDFYSFNELVPDSALKDYPTIRRPPICWSHTHVTNAELAFQKWLPLSCLWDGLAYCVRGISSS